MIDVDDHVRIRCSSGDHAGNVDDYSKGDVNIRPVYSEVIIIKPAATSLLIRCMYIFLKAFLACCQNKVKCTQNKAW